MSISHELSGEIAAALFAAKERSPGELKDLRDIVLKVHSTLEELAKKDLADRPSSMSDSGANSEKVKSAKHSSGSELP